MDASGAVAEATATILLLADHNRDSPFLRAQMQQLNPMLLLAYRDMTCLASPPLPIG